MTTDVFLLVSATDTSSDEETPQLSLQDENIQNIVRQAGDRPLSIFSIVGPQKTGKSLLFGFIAKYLSAVENDEIDWIDWKAKTQPVYEIKWPQTGVSPNTAGIWCFNRPFIIKPEEPDGDNEEVAVILLYTQSNQKFKWTENGTTSTLFGLSILASSSIIFNVTKQVDEKILQAATSIIQRAMVKKEKLEQRNGKPEPIFQEAMLLIRDWSHPSEFAYGISGGIKYVKSEKLREKIEQSKEARINRQIFTSIFGNVSGCLLPYPGNDAIKPNFKGSLAEMEPQFVEQLKDFITGFIDVERLPIKRNEMKRRVSGAEWKSMMASCIDLMNNTEMDECNGKMMLKQLGLKRTVLPGDDKENIKMALKLYNKTVIKYSKKQASQVLSDAALDEIHAKASKAAVKALKKEMLGAESEDEGNDDGSLKRNHKSAERQLKEKLEEKRALRRLERDRAKAQLVEHCQEEMIAQYSDSIKNAFSNRKTPPSEAEASKISKICREDFKRRFLDKLGERNEGANMSKDNQEAYDSFTQKLDEAEAMLLPGILKRRVTTKEEASLEGELAMSSIHNDVRTLAPKLHTTFDKPSSSEDLHKSSSKTFESPTKSKNLSSGWTGMDTKCESTGQKKSREQKRLENEMLREKANQLLSRLKNDYTDSMNAELEGIENLEKIHNKQMAVLVQQFENDCPFPSDGPDFRLYKSILQDDLKLAFTSVKSKQKQLVRKKQANIVKAIQNAGISFEEKLEQYLMNNENVEKKQLDEKARTLMDSEFSELKGIMSQSEFERIQQEVAEDLKIIFEKFRSTHERKRNITVHGTKRLMNDCKTEYNEKMSQIMNTLSSIKNLEREHVNLKNGIVDRFKKQFSLQSDKELLENQQNELEDEISTAYMEFQKLLEKKLKGEAGTAKLVASQARQYYKEEMDRHLKNDEFMLDANLHQLHTRISSEAVKMCLENTDKKQIKELKDGLEEMFKMYKDENDMNINEEPAIGIDLGTTFSCVAVYQKGKVKIIPNSVGKLTTPSYVLFQPTGEEIVGVEAKERAYENPEGTIFDAKRILGRRFHDDKLQEDMKLWPFTVVDGGHGIPMIEVNGKRYNPEVISAKILAQLKKDAELYLKRQVKKAVITVPAYFTDGQKQATVDAGKMAGLEVLSILNEPVAAAMAYKLQYSSGQLEADHERHILIFDLGGGTFDVAVLKTSKGNIEVLTVDGDTHLGGEDFDKNLMDYCAAEFKKVNGVDLFEGKDSTVKKVKDDVRRRLKRLQAECERQKIALASGISAQVSLDGIYKNMDLRVDISRSTFEKLNAQLFETTIQVVEKALSAAKLDKTQIDDVVLVGGSTRIPKIQRMLSDFFNGKELDKKINPDEAVAHGAGLLAAIKRGNIHKDNVAFTKIQDVTPMPIGVEVYGGAFSVIIPKSTKIPVKCEEKYRTAHNNQTSVQITIYEGEDKIAVKNKHLGDFYLNGIPPKEAGMENIDVEMLINDQGILHVTASVSSTGSKTAVTVTENKQRMGQAAIKRYIAEKTN